MELEADVVGFITRISTLSCARILAATPALSMYELKFRFRPAWED